MPPVVALVLRSLRRFGFARGMWSRSPPGRVCPAKLLELYAYEGCPSCRRVRQVLSELDLDYVHRTCPHGNSVHRRALSQRGAKLQFPLLEDPNTGVQMYDSREIVRYLEDRYGGASVP